MFNIADKPLGWTDDGDLLIHKPSDRLASVVGFDSLKRRIMFYLRTQPGDYGYDVGAGIGLENFAGRPNTDENREMIYQNIFDNLYDDSVTYPYHFSVDVKKAERHDVSITINVTGPTGTTEVALIFDLERGYIRTKEEFISDIEEITLPYGQEENENIYLKRKNS